MKHTYSDDIRGMRVAVFGPLPPPLGGVSVHVERTIAKLRRQGNTVSQFDTTQWLRYRFFFAYCMRLFFFLLIKRPQVLIYHTSYVTNALLELASITMWLQRRNNFLLAWWQHSNGSRLLLIEHDCRFVYCLSECQKKLYRHLLASVHTQVYIGTRTQQSFVENNIVGAQHHVIEAAFLPPDSSKKAELLSAYPPSVLTFIHMHRPVMVANAFQLSLVDDGDLYGFDQLVDAFARYKKNETNAGLVLMLAQIGDDQLFEQLRMQIAGNNIAERVCIVIGNRMLWPLFDHVHLFVRPTLSDGASVSVEEALYFGVPVVASDVCWRPAECVLYKAGDSNALYHSMKSVDLTRDK